MKHTSKVSRIIAIVAVTLSMLGIVGFLILRSQRRSGTVAVSGKPPTRPDLKLLLDIARRAIATRLPDTQLDNLELNSLSYRWSAPDELFDDVREDFSVDFRVQNSRTEVERDGKMLITYKGIDVDISPDGKIEKGGVSKQTETYDPTWPEKLDLAALQDESPQVRRTTHGEPVWGDPFYPLGLPEPLVKPSREQLASIARAAIAECLRDVSLDDLDLADFGYYKFLMPGIPTDGMFSVEYRVQSSVERVETDTEINVRYDVVSVLIAENGTVKEGDVSVRPGDGTYYKHGKASRPFMIPP